MCTSKLIFCKFHHLCVHQSQSFYSEIACMYLSSEKIFMSVFFMISSYKIARHHQYLGGNVNALRLVCS